MKTKYEEIVIETLGHASVRIESHDEIVIYIDPWGQVVAGTPSDASIVFVTHDDRDHYDPDAIQAISSDNTMVAIYEKIDTSDLEGNVTLLPYDSEMVLDGVYIQTVPAHNLPTGKHVRENGIPYHQKGEVIGLVIDIEGVRVYYPSDTDFLNDHREISADVLIPPIGGRPTMNRHEAVDLVDSVDPDLVLPIHYNTEGIEGISTNAKAFKKEVEAKGIRVDLL